MRTLGSLAIAAIGAATLSACGGGNSTPAMPSAPTSTTTAKLANRLMYRVIDAVEVGRGGVGARPSTVYSGCYEIYNAGPYAANLTLKLTPLGPNGEAYAVSPLGQQTRTIDVLHDIIGCGIPTVVDYDSTHQDATRYRLRVDASYEDGLTGSLEQEAAITYHSTPPPVVVISRFRVSGTRAGTADQFIEIQNVSSVAVQMTNVYVDIWIPRNPDPYAVFTTFRPFRGTIGPGCHWLIGAIGVNGTLSFVDGVPADGAWSLPLSSDGGIALRYPDGHVIDQVGMNVASVFREGQPLAPLTLGDIYTRVSDTGNNAADFRLDAAGGPRNSSSTCTAPFQ